METTGQSLMDFWSWAARKGLVSASVAHDLRAASKEVLAVEPDWVNMDVKDIDVDYLLVRFENLRRFDFKPQSLSAYKSRFKKARALYLKYLENPSGWHYPAPSRRMKRQGGAAVASGIDSSPAVPSAAAPVVSNEPPAGYQRLEFPLRPGASARLDLPADMTHDEAERLASYLKLIVP